MNGKVWLITILLLLIQMGCSSSKNTITQSNSRESQVPENSVPEMNKETYEGPKPPQACMDLDETQLGVWESGDYIYSAAFGEGGSRNEAIVDASSRAKSNDRFYNHFNKYLGKYFEDFSKEINNSKQYSLLNFCEDFKKQQLKKIANMTITKEKKTCESNHIFYAYFSGGIKKTVIDELFVYATHANSKIYRILSESRQFKTMEREILNNQVL